MAYDNLIAAISVHRSAQLISDQKWLGFFGLGHVCCSKVTILRSNPKMAATVRLPSQSQLSSREYVASCDGCLRGSHAVLALESRSDALLPNQRGELSLRRSTHLNRKSAIARLREGTPTCGSKASKCSSQLGSVRTDCTGWGTGHTTRSKARLLLRTGRRMTGGEIAGHGQGSLSISNSQSALGLRRRPSVQAMASESNAVVDRPAVKGKGVQKKEIYKGLEDSPAKVERCIIVDEENNVVGEASRQDTVGNRLWGRGVYCLVQNRRGQLLVTQRTEEKVRIV